MAVVDTRSGEETPSSDTMEEQKTSSSGLCTDSIKQNVSPSPVYEQFKKEGVLLTKWISLSFCFLDLDTPLNRENHKSIVIDLVSMLFMASPGNEFYAAGEYAKAVNAYNKAVKLDPNNGVLYRLEHTVNAFCLWGSMTVYVSNQ